VHTLDVILVWLVALIAIAFVAVVVRQRYMLRAGGAIPLAIRRHDARWSYGVARYYGGELRWFRAFGIGRRPKRVFVRSTMIMRSHRAPTTEELKSLPANAVVVECLVGTSSWTFAFGESAFTGFVSWLEAASGPLSGA
jgi:hypothetical protein